MFRRGITFGAPVLVTFVAWVKAEDELAQNGAVMFARAERGARERCEIHRHASS
jgi:hypothetical protein